MFYLLLFFGRPGGYCVCVFRGAFFLGGGLFYVVAVVVAVWGRGGGGIWGWGVVVLCFKCCCFLVGEV